MKLPSHPALLAHGRRVLGTQEVWHAMAGTYSNEGDPRRSSLVPGGPASETRYGQITEEALLAGPG